MTDQAKRGKELGASTVRQFYVCHPDGSELGLIAPRFDTEAEAIAKRDLWNQEVPGHYIMAITEAPPEFSCMPNDEMRDR